MLRRLAYFSLLVVFLLVMTLPIFAFVLAARGELRVGREEGSNLRLFMVITDEAKGIGVQRVRRTNAHGNCFSGSVRYLLWDGRSDGLNVDYCSCVDEQTGYTIASESCIDETS